MLGCDWGTTSFRMALCDTDTLNIIAELRSDEGVSQTFQEWRDSFKEGGVSKERFFRNRLGVHVARLSDAAGMPVDHIPIVISGMASSSLGMCELPYATLPFLLDGSNSVFKFCVGDEDLKNDILLLSGVSGEADVMRGEETQMLGLLQLLAAEGERPLQAILLFPGTHCKHIYIEGDVMVSFQTFMTGEVFGILRQHSILAASVVAQSLTGHTSEDISAFKAGVRTSQGSPLLNALFSVRTGQLMARFDKRHATYYLSGLLIGSELQSLSPEDDIPIVLCSSHQHDVYRFALDELGLLSRTTVLSSGVTERATLAGQHLLLSKIKEA